MSRRPFPPALLVRPPVAAGCRSHSNGTPSRTNLAVWRRPAAGTVLAVPLGTSAALGRRLAADIDRREQQQSLFSLLGLDMAQE